MRTTILFLLVTVLPSFLYGEIASRTFVDEKGSIYSITVEAPGTIDPRVFSESFGKDEYVLSTGQSNQAPINLSGYKIIISGVKASSAICRLVLQFARRSPTILDPKASFQIDATYAEVLNASFWPISGNVDVRLYANNKLCSRSAKPKNRLDTVGCYITNCVNDTFFLSVVVNNPSTTTEAVFVGTADTFFVNP